MRVHPFSTSKEIFHSIVYYTHTILTDERRAIPLLEDFALQELLSRALSLDAGVGT